MWCIHYNLKGIPGLSRTGSLPLAIEQACELLDQGADICEIEGTHRISKMNADEIKRIYAERKAKDNALH